ncbi:peptidase family M1-domain-containing protein [Mycena albidolilacea]|uniref:Peptidase family M1-domain-containing protein n=1 Tax=Mycena albidolilacea TaxID=1033008 RepID=A0AAD7A9D4_9AGAR|nr:peptidase family M1-domain-containing protein [Mycena albidolilacea]
MADLDPTTQSNYSQIASNNISFDWTLDFPAQILSGSATHHLNVLVNGVSEVIFDTADLEISRTEVEGKSVQHEIKSKHEVMGSALHIPLPAGLKSGTSITVAVFYKTTQDCTALQWLSKEQTQGKSFPYLFSQCQPIYARAMAPLQDTPSVKITYTATVSSILPVLLSAIRVSPPPDGPAHDGKIIGKDSVTYSYNQPVPIPSYLIAIASGNVRYKPFPKFEDKQWRTGIWAEPELLDAAYWEFSADTARFLAAEEKIVTPYRFGVYDLLVLPPSFPYGGMENACLSFLTPSLLAGDRTLVDVVVHELTHSWFGNGVTHAHATHFWLNEGWTTYMERLLLQVLHDSPAARGFSYVIGAKGLGDALKQYSNKPRYQRMVIDYELGEDPDDAYSDIPYEKGSNLILHLERTLGGLDVFLPYVKDYVNTYIGKSITTEQWKSHLYAYYERNGGPEKIKALDSIDWNAWFYGEGLKLPVEMEYDLTLAQAAYALATRWDTSRSVTETSALDFQKSDLDSFSSTQIVAFLERLQDYPALPDTHIKHLGTVYGVSTSTNAEIRLRFYNLALSPPTSAAASHFAPEAIKWVVGTDGSGVIKGRMKFCRPVFRAVFQVNEGLAKEAWEKNQSEFHPIARKLIDKDLGLV